MAATDAQKNFAQSRIEFFYNVLKNGKNDKIKALLSTIKESDSSFNSYTADKVAAKIKGSAEFIKSIKDISVGKDAQSALKTASEKITALQTTYNGTNNCNEDSLVAFSKNAKVAKFFKDAYELTGLKESTTIKEVLATKLETAPDATKVTNALTSATADDLKEIAIALGILKADGTDTDGVYFTDDGAYDSSDLKNNKKKFNDLGNNDKKKAAIKAYLSGSFYKTKDPTGTPAQGDKVEISKADGTVNTLFGQTEAVLETKTVDFKDQELKVFFTESSGKFEATDLAKALFGSDEAEEVAKFINLYNEKKPADATEIKTTDKIKDASTNLETFANNVANPEKYKNILEKATEYLKAGSQDIQDLTKVTQNDIEKANSKLFEKYGLINALIKNIPHKATKVLKDNGSSKFTGYDDDIKTASDDIKKAVKAYHKISLAVCGSTPFAQGDDIPQPKLKSFMPQDYTKKCLDQFNTLAYTVLNTPKCGSDEKSQDCYDSLGKADLKDLTYNMGSEELRIDISGDYLFNEAVSSSVKVEL